MNVGSWAGSDIVGVKNAVGQSIWLWRRKGKDVVERSKAARGCCWLLVSRLLSTRLERGKG